MEDEERNMEKNFSYLVKLGLLETKREKGEDMYRVSSKGLQMYAAHLTMVCAVAEDPTLAEGRKPKGAEDEDLMRKSIEEARKVAAKVQEAVQSKKDMDESDPYFKKAQGAAMTVVVHAAGEPPTEDEILGPSHVYFKMLAQKLTPENLELWLYGKKAPTIEGPIFTASHDT